MLEGEGASDRDAKEEDASPEIGDDDAFPSPPQTSQLIPYDPSMDYGRWVERPRPMTRAHARRGSSPYSLGMRMHGAGQGRHSRPDPAHAMMPFSDVRQQGLGMGGNYMPPSFTTGVFSQPHAATHWQPSGHHFADPLQRQALPSPSLGPLPTLANTPVGFPGPSHRHGMHRAPTRAHTMPLPPADGHYIPQQQQHQHGVDMHPAPGPPQFPLPSISQITAPRYSSRSAALPSAGGAYTPAPPEFVEGSSRAAAQPEGDALGLRRGGPGAGPLRQ